MKTARSLPVVLVLLVAASLHAATLYNLDTPLGPTKSTEVASASVLLNQDVISTLTLSFTYQLQGRFALLGLLFAGSPFSAPVFTVSGLPPLTSFGSSSTAVVDDSLIFQLLNEPVFVRLITTEGSLDGLNIGSLALSANQGIGHGGSPPPGIPEPATLTLSGAALVGLAAFTSINAGRRAHLRSPARS